MNLVSAIRATWGGRGVARRATYELARRSGVVRRREAAWCRRTSRTRARLTTLELERPSGSGAPRLYGHLAVPLDGGSDRWRVHPTTGRVHPLVHWSELDEGDPTAGDVKDLWELGRLTWSLSMLGDAEAVWLQVESFAAANPGHRGPQWMCGQESALRGIVLMLIASALSDDPATSPERMALLTDLVVSTVGRVRPTLGYALSQRNNHAVSEAAFLWAAAMLVEDLPGRSAIRRAADRALREVSADQWYEDGAYAQHSPTYQRLGVQALLFVIAVSRATGTPAPRGVATAVARSASFLARLVDPDSGAAPYLGGNDGALLFDLTDRPIGDLRPVVVHAFAATGGPSPYPPGPWDAEALAFGLDLRHEPTPRRSDPDGIAHHVHVGPASASVLRAGPIRHRPAHADQLHVDVWIGGTNVTLDAGCYRYTAPPPWANALAGEEVHCLPRVPSRPQARRRGRFFWSSWSTAAVVARHRTNDVDVTLVELDLGDDVRLRRLVARIGDRHVVVDRTPPGTIVRWTLPAGTELRPTGEGSSADGDGWHARFVHASPLVVRTPAEDDPTSGWVSPTYAARVAALAVELPSTGEVIAVFGPGGEELSLPGWIDRAFDGLPPG